MYLGQPYVVTEEGEEPPPSPLGSTAEEERIRELGKPCLGMSKVYMLVEGKFGEYQFIHLQQEYLFKFFYYMTDLVFRLLAHANWSLRDPEKSVFPSRTL